MDGFVSMNDKYELSDTDSTQKIGVVAANLTTEGNVMVRLPKFYCEVKMTQYGRRLRIYDYQNPTGKIALGIKPHPVFWENENGTESAERYYLSAFDGSIKDDRLVSIAGVNPQVSQNINWFRTLKEYYSNAWSDRLRKNSFSADTGKDSGSTICNCRCNSAYRSRICRRGCRKYSFKDYSGC